MSAYTTISPDKLSRLLGSPEGPTLIDIRQEAEFAADPRRIPGAVRRDAGAIALWGRALAGTATIVIGQLGANLSHGVAAWLRHDGVRAETLEGGHEGWAQGGTVANTCRLSRGGRRALSVRADGPTIVQ
jgi:rhodanese-related sulfurtransferase